MICISESIFELVRQAELLTNETTIYFYNHFSENIGISQILVLSELREQGPMMQTGLANKLGYSPGGMTSIANKLVKEGHAKRVYEDSDRRIVRLAITEAGINMLRKAQAEGQNMRRELYSVLSEEEIQQMISIQKRLYQHITKIRENEK